MPASPRTPADHLGAIILHLGLTLDGHSTWGRLARPLAMLIIDRLRRINQLFRRTADRVAAGTYVPRHCNNPRRRGKTKPRRPDPLPKQHAWLVHLVQETGPFGSQLQCLFAEPDMVALMQAAPSTLRRPLRSLCRMLGAVPPPILALEKRPRPQQDQAPPEPPPLRPPFRGEKAGVRWVAAPQRTRHDADAVQAPDLFSITT